MAFTNLLRGAASRSSNCYMQTFITSARFNSGPSTFTRGSSLFPVLNGSARQQSAAPRLFGVQFIRNSQVRPFSLSPKVFSAAAHNHSSLWTLERALSAALLLLVPAALASPNKLLDTLAAIGVVMHSHWGIEATVIDYVRPILFGTTVPKVALMSVYALSILTMAGLLNLIYNDIGLANTVRKIWKL